jgi:hypothetical protein
MALRALRAAATPSPGDPPGDFFVVLPDAFCVYQ